ncbi:MAG TPA: winged helix-turn-helix domain-containing protein [Candidatus Polarisedimenticolaceae bacterium]|nr:winged helix-turn-helix domain-containing protein [Candidatus Polarisedimenticolaceae bacterium]
MREVSVMGRTSTTVGSASALFTPIQLRVLGLLFGQADRRYQTSEFMRLARGGTGATHRQLRRLAAAGLVRTTSVGNEKYYQADASSPLFGDLRGLIVKTAGVIETTRLALSRLARIRAAFVHDAIGNEIQLVVISDTLAHTSLRHALAPVEKSLGRAINATILSQASWRAWRSGFAIDGAVMVLGDAAVLDD